MNVWSTLRRRMLRHGSRPFAVGKRGVTYRQALSAAENFSAVLSERGEQVWILCRNKFLTAIAVLGCFAAGKTAVLGKTGSKVCERGDSTDVTIVRDEDVRVITKQSKLKRARCDTPLILFTSGTTGRGRGVMLPHRGLLFNIKSIHRAVRYGRSDTILIARPLFHVSVIVADLLAGIYAGAGFVFYEKDFMPECIHEVIREQSVTVFNATPTMFYLCYRRRVTLPVRKATISGEVLTRVRFACIAGVLPKAEIFAAYGMTEAGPRISMGRIDGRDFANGYAGRILKHVAVKIKNGCVWFRSPGGMLGYLGGEKAQGRIWRSTGDLGAVSGRRLYVFGRTDGVIIRGGVNIDPAAVEEVLLRDSRIVDCRVYGEPDEALGQRVCAGVVPLDESVTEEYVRRLSVSSLSPEMQIGKIEIISDHSAITESGKRRLGEVELYGHY